MLNNFQICVNLAIYDPFYQWEFDEIKEYFTHNYFRVIRISKVFYIKTYQSKEAILKTLNKTFKDVHFEISNPKNDSDLFTDIEYMDQEILNRREIKTKNQEEEYLNTILDKISEKKDPSLEEKFFLEYFSRKK